MSNISGNRPYIFLVSIFASYLIPSIIPGTGIDYPFVFTVGLILLAWFIFKWNSIKSLDRRPKIYETCIGLAVVILDIGENAYAHSNLGLIDMLLIFAALSIAFYGISSMKFFVAPYLYLLILIVGYQVENNLPQLIGLQYALAGLMADFMRAIGVSATVDPSHPNIVYLQNYLADGSIYTIGLQVDGPCTGLKGILAFGLLSSMALIDTKPSRKQLAILLSIGFAGAFLINIARLAVIFLTFEYLGMEAGKTMHIYAGYTLFIIWVLAFWSIAYKHILPLQQTNSIINRDEGSLPSAN